MLVIGKILERIIIVKYKLASVSGWSDDVEWERQNEGDRRGNAIFVSADDKYVLTLPVAQVPKYMTAST